MPPTSSAAARTDLRRTAVFAVLVGLAFMGTMFIRVPVPATTGYFNIGDIFVILAGLWLGPWAGLIVGLLGPSAADFIGFPAFVPATAVTKGLEGLVTGLIAKSGRSQGVSRSSAAAACGGLVIVVGYYIFEAAIYPWIGQFIPLFAITTPAAAVVEVPVNLVQGLIGATGAVALWRLVSGGEQTSRSSRQDRPPS